MTTPTPRDRIPYGPHLQRSSLRPRERGCTVAASLVLFVQLVACGGSKPRSSRYEQAISKQQACCQGLQDSQARQQCEQSIVKLDDGSSADSEVNEATFHCVENHFVCDTSTGKATPEANQATLDCLTDLSQ